MIYSSLHSPFELTAAVQSWWVHRVFR